MLIITPFRRTSALAAGSLLGLLAACSIRSEVFTIDTNRSSITVSGNILGSTFMEQAPGSLTTDTGGTIQAAVTGSMIQFPGQSLIQPQVNGSWQPMPDGSPGSAPADYGAQASSLLGNGVAALRNLQVDVVSSNLTLTAGQFDAQGLVFGFPATAPSSFAYNITGFFSLSGSQPLTGYATNEISTSGSLATVGSQTVLTLPISAKLYLSLVTDNDTLIQLDGQLVATLGASPPPLVASITIQNQQVSLQWQAPANQQFQVQSSTDLTAWQTNAIGITSATTLYSWSGPVSGPIRFFRLAK